MPVAALLASVALGALGQVLFKLGVRGGAPLPTALASPFVVLGALAYAASTLFWLQALSRLPLSVAYPFLSLNFVLVPLAGHLLFREPLSAPQLAGCLLIAAGVAFLYRRWPL